jgi:hypothetical protein
LFYFCIIRYFASQTNFRTGLTGLLLAFKLELLLLVLIEEVAEFPLESSDFGKKLISDFEEILLVPLTIDGLTSWGILFGDLTGDLAAFALGSFDGERWVFPICVVFTGLALM